MLIIKEHKPDAFDLRAIAAEHDLRNRVIPADNWAPVFDLTLDEINARIAAVPHAPLGAGDPPRCDECDNILTTIDAWNTCNECRDKGWGGSAHA